MFMTDVLRFTAPLCALTSRLGEQGNENENENSSVSNRLASTSTCQISGQSALESFGERHSFCFAKHIEKRSVSSLYCVASAVFSSRDMSNLRTIDNILDNSCTTISPQLLTKVVFRAVFCCFLFLIVFVRLHRPGIWLGGHRLYLDRWLTVFKPNARTQSYIGKLTAVIETSSTSLCSDSITLRAEWRLLDHRTADSGTGEL
jgi:hypothetical protein